MSAIRRSPARFTKLARDPAALFKFLKNQGAFTLPFFKARFGHEKPTLTIVRAAATPMWPMGTHFWVRDNAFVGLRLVNIELADEDFEKELRAKGESILWSTLNILSTPTQLIRFKNIIENYSDDFVNAAANWPQIFLSIKSNLSGAHHEGWSHKQDAWQILAHSVLQLLESGRLSLDSLTFSHKEFFALLVPFLAKVRYYRQENSGSWEELEAVRTSVVAWDLALLNQINRLAGYNRFAFLRSGFERYRSILANYGDTSSFQNFVNSIMLHGAEHIRAAMPYECPLYPVDDPRHRKADAALIYLLQLDIPRLVANLLNLPDSWIAQSEAKLLKAVETLYDERTGAYRRYHKDSYQRKGYFRAEVVKRLAEFYGSPSSEYSSGFTGRDAIVPKGPEAAWTHFSWQLCAWAGRRYSETKDKKYAKMHQTYYQRAVRTITQKGEESIELSPKGRPRKKKIPAYRFPECYLTEEDKRGKEYLFPTPHTPLNWATAEALSAFSSMFIAAKTRAKTR